MADLHRAQQLSQDQVFLSSVRAALYVVAEEVLSETNANHAERLPLAQRILMGPEEELVKHFAKVIAALNSSAIDADLDKFGLSDTQFENTVRTSWNSFSGVDEGGTS